MTETHGRLRNVSKLVAHFERAKMILEEEQKLSPQSLYPSEDETKVKSPDASRASRLLAAISDKPPEVEEAAPRWLHVLLPAELERKEEKDSAELKRIVALDTSVHQLQDAVLKEQQKLVDMVGATDRTLRERDKGQRDLIHSLRAELKSELERALGPSTSILSRVDRSGSLSGSGGSLAAMDRGSPELRSPSPSTSAVDEVTAVRSEMRALQEHIARAMNSMERKLGSLDAASRMSI